MYTHIDLREALYNNDVDVVQKIVDSNSLNLAHYRSALLKTAKQGKADLLKLLLPFFDRNEDDNDAIEWAANNGHAECVKLLIPVSNMIPENNASLRFAAVGGHVECVRILLPLSNTKSIGLALWQTAEVGHEKVLKMLIPASEKKDINYALVHAVIKNHINCVKTLIPFSDVKDDNSSALYAASRIQNNDLVDLLYPLSDAKLALERLKNNFSEPQKWEYLEKLFHAHEEKRLLTQVVTPCVKHSLKKKL